MHKKPLDNKLLLIGKLPPPIGGVTIHVKRLKESLDHERIAYEYRKLTKINILRLLFGCFYRNSIIHLHTSSPLIRMLVSFIGMMNDHQIIIITYHGDIGRFKYIKNWIDRMSIKFSNVPIVLNEQSYKIAKSINTNTKLISAFIPPITNEILSLEIQESLARLKENKQYIFCTNAYNLSYDKHKNEIYSGTLLIKLFCKKENQKHGFIFSDPSGNYIKHFKRLDLKLTENILIIYEKHSFFEILKKSDCFIRFTTTDGDPLSVKEALYLKKIVFATNVICRPRGVFTFHYNNQIELQYLINQIDKLQSIEKSEQLGNGAKELLDLYKEISQT